MSKKPASARSAARPAPGGFTLVELLASVTIVGILATMGIGRVHDAIYLAQVARATTEIRGLEQDIQQYEASEGSYPPDLAAVGDAGLLDPWGHPYQYLRISTAGVVGGSGSAGSGGNGGGHGGGNSGGNGGGNGAVRKDRFLVPLNSDFDLYSLGRDGQSVAPLTAAQSRDDIVRANDGGFVGLASRY